MTRKWGRMATYPKLGNSQFSPHEERSHGDTPHSVRVYVPSPNRSSPWSSGSRNLGPNIKGQTGFVAILSKTAKIHQKVVIQKIVSLYHKRDRPWAFAWVQTEALLPLRYRGCGSKRQGNIFNTPILKHTIYGEKCIYWRYWHAYIYGSLRNKNMSKHFWSRPIVIAFKYAHYG